MTVVEKLLKGLHDYYSVGITELQNDFGLTDDDLAELGFVIEEAVVLDYDDFKVYTKNGRYFDHLGNELELVHLIPYSVHIELAEEDVFADCKVDYDYSGESDLTSDYLFFRQV